MNKFLIYDFKKERESSKSGTEAVATWIQGAVPSLVVPGLLTLIYTSIWVQKATIRSCALSNTEDLFFYQEQQSGISSTYVSIGFSLQSKVKTYWCLS